MNTSKKPWDSIPMFPRANYEIDVGWGYLERQIEHFVESYGLDLDPDYQRAHVWKKSQQVAYLEYVLKGGEVGRNITFVCKDWNGDNKDFALLDGKQRLEAVRQFMAGKLRVFPDHARPEGYCFTDFSGHFRWITHNFKFRVVECATKADILRLYLNINAGGTPHTKKELDKVSEMLFDLEAEER